MALVDPFLQSVQGFYNTHLELATGGLAGAVFTILLTKLFPSAYITIKSILSSIGQKISKRYAYRSIRKTYLNWVVIQNQDLSLTGIIDTREKLGLGHLFIPINLKSESKEHTHESEYKLKDSIDDVIYEINRLILKEIRERYYKAIPLSLFIVNSYWNIEQKLCKFGENSWRRTGVLRILGALLHIILVYLIPIYGLFLKSELDSILAAFSIYIWLRTIQRDIYLRLNGKRKGVRNSLEAIFIAIGIIYFFNYRITNYHQISILMWVGILIPIIFFAVGKWIDYTTVDPIKKLDAVANELGELILKNDYLAIIGKPGSGKSTIMQFIALTFAQEKAGANKYNIKKVVEKRFGISKWFLPIFIPLRSISEFLKDTNQEQNGTLLIEAFRQQVLPSDMREIFTSKYIHHMLTNCSCIILLDGLDEVVDDAEYNAIIKDVKGLISRYPGNKVVVTSRYSGWKEGLGSSFKRFEIDEISVDQINKFIDSWYQAVEGITEPGSNSSKQKSAAENADRLKNALKDDDNLSKLAQIPLLLSIMCFVNYNKVLPKNRTALYQMCSNLLLNLWDQYKGLEIYDTNLNILQREALMEEIAFALHSGKIGSRYGRKEFTRSEIIPIIEDMLESFKVPRKEAEAIFQKIVDRSGVLVLTDEFGYKYSFSHLTFQEFYTAKYLTKNNINIFEMLEQVSEEKTTGVMTWWREVLLLYSAMQIDPTWIIEELLRREEGDVLHRNFQLASQCLLEAGEIPNHEIERLILHKILCMRYYSKDISEITTYPSEIKQYLLNFAIRENFLSYVLQYNAYQIKSNENAKELYSSLVELISSGEHETQLACIKAIGIIKNWSNDLDIPTRELIDKMISNTNINIRISSINLIINNQSQIDDELMHKFIEKIVELLEPTDVIKPWWLTYSLYTEVLGEMDLFCLKPNNSLNILLQNTIKLISNREDFCLSLKQELIRIMCLVQNRIYIFLFNHLSYDIYRHLFTTHMVCIGKIIDSLDDNEQKLMHKQQLLDIINKGFPDLQAMIIPLIAGVYSYENDIVDSILQKLNSPFIKVRIEALTAIGGIELNDKQRLTAKEILSTIAEKAIRYKWLQRYMHKILLKKSYNNLIIIEYIKSIELLMTLTSNNISLSKALIFWYQELSVEKRWTTINAMPDGVITMLSEKEIEKFLSFIKDDFKEAKDEDPSGYYQIFLDIIKGYFKGAKNENFSGYYQIAIEFLGKLYINVGDELKKKIASILLEIITNRRDKVGFSALKAYNELPLNSRSMDEYHKLQLIKSTYYPTADLAFEIIMEPYMMQDSIISKG